MKATAQRSRTLVDKAIANDGVAIFPPCDVFVAMRAVSALELSPVVAMLDPWYNKGMGGERPWSEYDSFIHDLIRNGLKSAPHVFLWGFPEIVARYINEIPTGSRLVAWLTWYYKNNPSVIRGWRSAQMTCLHLSHEGAPLFPQHFLNEKQLEKQRQGKLRYMPGPPSVLVDSPGEIPNGHDDVIEQPLNIGFVRRAEQTGHPAQKPEAVYERLALMVSQETDLLFDPLAGSGTLGAVARTLGRTCILADANEEYVAIMERRLGSERVAIDELLAELPDGED